MPDPFKTCPRCRAVWPDRSHFLADPAIETIGYQVDFVELTGGLFLFNHVCGDTLAVAAKAFADLADRPIKRPSLRGTDACERHCLHDCDLDPCRALCECAYVRDILQVVRAWPKRNQPGAGAQ